MYNQTDVEFTQCTWLYNNGRKKDTRQTFKNNEVSALEHKTCDILAAERLRLMRFDNRLIIDSFQEAVCLLKW